VALCLHNGKIHANATFVAGCGAVEFVVGQSVFDVRINLNERYIKWSVDGHDLWIFNLSKEITNQNLYPTVWLHNQGD